MRELRAVALALGVNSSGNGLQCTAGWHQHDTAHLKLMGTGETLDGFVTVIITRCLPTVLVAQVSVGTGTGLGHTEGHSAGGEVEITAMSRSDTRLHIISVPLRDGLRGITTRHSTYGTGKQQ